MTAFPLGVVGGAIASLSSFNPFRLPGLTTGSYWTLQYYDDSGSAQDERDSEKAMEWVEEGSER